MSEIKDLVIGTGQETVQNGDVVTVTVRSNLRDSTVIDSGAYPITFAVGRGPVVNGLQSGILGMRTGGHRRLALRSDQAFGQEGIAQVPGGTKNIYGCNPSKHFAPRKRTQIPGSC